MSTKIERPTAGVRSCRKCRCTDDDCHRCIERTGEPCGWSEKDLCSACVGKRINVLQEGYTVIIPLPKNAKADLFCGQGHAKRDPGKGQVQIFDDKADALRLRDLVRETVDARARVVKVTYTVRSEGVAE